MDIQVSSVALYLRMVRKGEWYGNDRYEFIMVSGLFCLIADLLTVVDDRIASD